MPWVAVVLLAWCLLTKDPPIGLAPFTVMMALGVLMQWDMYLRPSELLDLDHSVIFTES